MEQLAHDRETIGRVDRNVNNHPTRLIYDALLCRLDGPMKVYHDLARFLGEHYSGSRGCEVHGILSQADEEYGHTWTDHHGGAWINIVCLCNRASISLCRCDWVRS